MAANQINPAVWKEVMNTVSPLSSKKSGIVSVIHEALGVLLADGQPREVRTLQLWIEAGLNKDVAEEDKVEVHWATVKHALKSGPYVEVSHNTFTNGGAVKPRKQRGRK